MKINEVITEKLQPEIVNSEPFVKNYQIGEYKYVANFSVGETRVLTIKAYDNAGAEVGAIDFEVIDEEPADKLVSIDTFVEVKHRRKGIATVMYRIAKELGNDILPSKYQSRAGKKMWKGMQSKGSLDEEQGDTIALWHGGKGLEHSHSEVTSSKKGRWQHGPGLYLTNSYARAQEYARGGRKVYRVTINRGTEITKVQIPYKDVLGFANQYIPSAKRKQFLMSIQENMERMGTDTVGANVFLNLIINWESVPSSKTNVIAQFLVQHGVDYAISSFGGFENEKVVVLFNRSKIVKVEHAVPKTIGGTDFDINPITENIGKNKNKIYDILIKATGSGPFDGGCVVMAEAIQMKYGGDIMVLVGHAQRDTNEVAQHAVVKLDNILVDYDGAFEPREFIKRFERNELTHAGGYITGVRPIQNGDLPDALRNPEVAAQISRLLK